LSDHQQKDICQDNGHLSNPEEVCLNPAFAKIIALDFEPVLIILSEKQVSLTFFLTYIYGAVRIVANRSFMIFIV
jgi:hypothetical protein